jgi:hypothetical protein
MVGFFVYDAELGKFYSHRIARVARKRFSTVLNFTQHTSFRKFIAVHALLDFQVEMNCVLCCLFNPKLLCKM